MLRQGHLDQAVEELLAFNNKADSKVASAASNNLALVNFLVLPFIVVILLHKISAVVTNWRMLSNIVNRHSAWTGKIIKMYYMYQLFRYNANALVNRGNLHFQRGESQEALHYFREALQVDAGNSAAILFVFIAFLNKLK